MKRNSLLLVLVFLAATAIISSQQLTAQDATKSLAENLGFMIGDWEGEGVARGEHEFIGKLTVTTELEGTALLVRRESMNKSGGPSGGLQEMMIIGFDGTTKKVVGTLYDNKSGIALYVGDIKDKEISFSLAAAPEGYVSKRIFKLLPDSTLSFIIEGAVPGKSVSELVEITFKKKM